MKRIKIICLLALWGGVITAQAKEIYGIQHVSLQGYVGKRIDGCLEKRVMGQNTDELTVTYTHPRDVQGQWASEFWGKWVQGAIAYYQYNQDPALYAKIKYSVEKMIAAQLDNGYLGDYDQEHQLTAWDVWGRKYTLLGLIKWYRLSGDKQALRSACRLLDYTLTQIGPNGKHIYETGYFVGMPPSSILEPVMFLYNETKDARYLDFAKFIVSDDESANGPRLIAKCDEPVSQRFPLKSGQSWFGPQNGQKGYEMMSCYVGLLELYKVTGQQEYLHAAKTAYQHVLSEEMNIAGGACSLECFYGGKKMQTHPCLHMMETCVTFTLMQYAERLMQITGQSTYVDDIERTMYNALMASMKADNSQIVKYVPLEGYRREGENQCGVKINCCNANAPRAFAMIPRLTYRMPSNDRIDVNLYIPSQVSIQMGKRKIELAQDTQYPQDNTVTLSVNPDKPVSAQIALRIPQWSQETTVEINGEKQEGVKAGSYYLCNRTWKAGDQIRIIFQMPARLVVQDEMVAVERGPIVFARDSRFNDGFVDETVVIPSQDGVVELTPATSNFGAWMTYTLPVVCGPYNDSSVDTRQIHFCDFASAGSTWDESQRYKVWLPVLHNPSIIK